MTQPDDTGPETVVSEISWLRRLARSLVRDEPTADDVVQDACVAAMHGPPPQRGRVRGWLAAVVRNAARRSHRDRLRRAGREALAARPEVVPGAAETAERLETARTLLAAVESLDEPYRTAVRLRWLDGLTPREVAARLGVSQEVVWKRLSRGLAMLRARLDRDRGGRAAWLWLTADLGHTDGRDVALRHVARASSRWLAGPALAVLVAAAAGVVATSAFRAGRDANEGATAASSGHKTTSDVTRASDAQWRRRARATAPDALGLEPSAGRDVAQSSAATTARESSDATQPLPADRIVGRVLEPSGAPIWGARFRLEGPGPQSTALGNPSDIDGRFVCATPSDAGSKVRIVIRAEGRAAAIRRFDGLPSGEVDLGEIRLAPATPITGVVIDSSARPVPQAHIVGYCSGGAETQANTTTNAAGAFRLDRADAGEWRLSVLDINDRAAETLPFSATVAGGTQGVRLVLRRRTPGTTNVAIDLVDADGQVVGLSEGFGGGAMLLSAGSFADGRDFGALVQSTNPRTGLTTAEIQSLRPGNWLLWLRPKGFGPTLVPLHVDPWETTKRLRVVAAPAAAVHIRVDFAGFPMPAGATVFVGGREGVPLAPRLWAPPFAIGGQARLQDDGTFLLEGVVPGEYRLWLAATGWYADAATVAIDAGVTADAHLTARPGGSVAWSPSVPVGCELEAAFATGECDFVTLTEASGTGRPTTLQLPGFPPGRLRWRLRVAQRDVLASEGRTLATYMGETTVVAGATVTLPEGPFAGPDDR